MINSIQIKNYRGIHQIEIDNFMKYNLFTGDNNSIKTSLLEALALSNLNKNFLDKIINKYKTTLFYNNENKILIIKNDRIELKIDKKINISNEEVDLFIFLDFSNYDYNFINSEIKKWKKELSLYLNFIIEDISIEKDVKIKLKNEEIYLPINQIGRSFLNIISLIIACLGDYNQIFIDNLEGIHFLNYPKLCKIITKLLENSNKQLFIVSNSVEFIQNLSYILRDINEDIILYRFIKYKNNIHKKYYKREEIISNIHNGWDVR